jgi:hypothetical protein
VKKYVYPESKPAPLFIWQASASASASSPLVVCSKLTNVFPISLVGKCEKSAPRKKAFCPGASAFGTRCLMMFESNRIHGTVVGFETQQVVFFPFCQRLKNLDISTLLAGRRFELAAARKWVGYLLLT